jgi:hypothetical protein
MIAEAQEWLKQKRASFHQSQIANLRIAIFDDHVAAQGWHGSRFEIGCGQSVEQAFNELQKRFPTPESSILRAAAAEMIERAEKLEAQ